MLEIRLLAMCGVGPFYYRQTSRNEGPANIALGVMNKLE
jgi:hypothetical protein